MGDGAGAEQPTTERPLAAAEDVMAMQRSTGAIVLALTTLIVAGCTFHGGMRQQPIPQPDVSAFDAPLAPDSQRVDLVLPTFSHPTKITNALFPVSTQHSVLFVGTSDGKPFRTEVTLLPYTRIVQWHGVRIEAAVSQYLAFVDGRIEELALDLYAQADDGSVWYLGEDVSDFVDGAIASKEGSWTAGVSGPPAMIMPADPKVGDAYRSENWPGIAFEQITVTSLDEHLKGPFGAVEGGMAGAELHADGETEKKFFAPGYGEFFTSDPEGVEALALSVPTDAAGGAMPASLTELTRSARAVMAAAVSGNWADADAGVASVQAAVESLSTHDVPRLLRPVLQTAVDELAGSVGARDVTAAVRAGISTARWSYDLQLRYRPVPEIDRARLDLWAATVELDAADGDGGAVGGDVFTMTAIADRFIRDLDAGTAQRLALALDDLQLAALDGELDAASRLAGEIRETLAHEVR